MRGVFVIEVCECGPDLRLAGVPQSVLEMAQMRSDQLKLETEERRALNVAKRAQALLRHMRSSDAPSVDILKNMSTLYKLLG